MVLDVAGLDYIYRLFSCGNCHYDIHHPDADNHNEPGANEDGPDH